MDKDLKELKNPLDSLSLESIVPSGKEMKEMGYTPSADYDDVTGIPKAPSGETPVIEAEAEAVPVEPEIPVFVDAPEESFPEEYEDIDAYESDASETKEGIDTRNEGYYGEDGEYYVEGDGYYDEDGVYHLFEDEGYYDDDGVYHYYDEEDLDEDGNPKKKKRKIKKRWIIIGSIFAFLAACYLTFVYAPIPWVRKWRNIYIETAMSTTSHHWLATWFIPHNIIDEVIAARDALFEGQKDLESKWDSDPTPVPSQTPVPIIIDPAEQFFETYWELDSPSVRKYLEKHSIDTEEEFNNLKINNMDGEKKLYTVKKDLILSLNVKNSLILLGLEGDTYVGKMAIVKDPSLVCLGKASNLGSQGDVIDRFGENYDAVLAINASGFRDKGGHGTGGSVRGSLVIDGVEYGQMETNSNLKFYGMKKKNNQFYICNPWSVNVKKFRWGMQFFPALIVDGKIVVEGTFGMGLQPRSTVGQAKDGTFMMVIVDGRQIGYSIGCTVEECANQMKKYHAYQGANLDGGSSSIMWYEGSQITKSSSPSGFGRYLPNSLYIKRVH